LRISEDRLGIDWKSFQETVKASTAFVLAINGEYAFVGDLDKLLMLK
jgi:hypothetical protein